MQAELDIELVERRLLRTFSARPVAYVASLLVVSGQAICFGLVGFNSNVGTQFIQLHDSNVLPADGAIPEVFTLAAAGSPFSFDFGYHGRPFDRGIYICNSSTGPTKTLGAADCWFDVQYI